MQLTKIKIDQLKPAAYNPRKNLQPGDPEYESLCRSMAEFGYVEPIVWNKTTGNVVGGHQRLKVLADLGHTEIDCVVVELDTEKEKALNLALNKISGDWDVPLLKDLLEELHTADFDTDLTGFDGSEIENIIEKSYLYDIDAILDKTIQKFDMNTAIKSPAWLVARTSIEKIDILEQAAEILEQGGIKIERSYYDAHRPQKKE